MVQSLWKTVQPLLIKLNTALLGNPAVTVLCIYSVELKILNPTGYT